MKQDVRGLSTKGERMKSRFLSTYYLAHFICFGSYFLVRNSQLAAHSLLFAEDFFGLTREAGAFVTLVFLLAIAYRRSWSIDNFLATAFVYTKVALLALSLMVDWRITAWYAVAILILFIVLPQPSYNGPHSVIPLSPAVLDVLLSKSATAWLVEFYVGGHVVLALETINATDFTFSSSEERQFWPLFAQLSVEYSTDHLRFGQIDIAKYDSIAKRYNLPSDSTLPTLILFEHGKERTRLPASSNSNARRARRSVATVLNRRDIVQCFNLNYYISKSNGAASHKAAVM